MIFFILLFNKMKDLYKKQFSEYLEKFMDELKKSSDKHKKTIEENYDKYGDYINEINFPKKSFKVKFIE